MRENMEKRFGEAYTATEVYEKELLQCCVFYLWEQATLEKSCRFPKRAGTRLGKQYFPTLHPG